MEALIFGGLIAVVGLLILVVAKTLLLSEPAVCGLCGHKWVPPSEWGLPKLDCPRCGVRVGEDGTISDE